MGCSCSPSCDRCGAGGRRGMAIDGELHKEEEAAGELDSPASVAGTSSCKWALADEKATTV
jgi:hypothetical protein